MIADLVDAIGIIIGIANFVATIVTLRRNKDNEKDNRPTQG